MISGYAIMLIAWLLLPARCVSDWVRVVWVFTHLHGPSCVLVDAVTYSRMVPLLLPVILCDPFAE